MAVARDKPDSGDNSLKSQPSIASPKAPTGNTALTFRLRCTFCTAMCAAHLSFGPQVPPSMPPDLLASERRARKRDRRSGSAQGCRRIERGGVDSFQGQGEGDARAEDGRMARGEHDGRL